MDKETLFTSSKWDILKILSTQKKSPLELSRLANTSMANVSQQLRLLEFAGIVKSERISNRDKDMPRVLYSLAADNSFLICVSDNFVSKKFVEIDDYHKAILRIWFLENKELHYFIEKAFWKIESYLAKIDAIYVDTKETKDIALYIVTKDAATKKSFTDFTIKHPATSVTRQVKFKFLDGLDKVKKDLYQIYSCSTINKRLEEVTK